MSKSKQGIANVDTAAIMRIGLLLWVGVHGRGGSTSIILVNSGVLKFYKFLNSHGPEFLSET